MVRAAGPKTAPVSARPTVSVAAGVATAALITFPCATIRAALPAAVSAAVAPPVPPRAPISTVAPVVLITPRHRACIPPAAPIIVPSILPGHALRSVRN